MIDIILCIFLIIGFVRGFYKGFLLELAGIVALVAGVFGAIHFSGHMYGFLQSFITWEERYLTLLAFALTFILIVVAVSLIGNLLTKMVNIIMLGFINRILGAVFGFLKMAFLASLFFMFVNQTEVFTLGEETVEDSILYPPVERIAPVLLPTILRKLREENFFDRPFEDAETTEEESEV